MWKGSNFFFPCRHQGLSLSLTKKTSLVQSLVLFTEFENKLRVQRGLSSCRVSVTRHELHSRLVSRWIAGMNIPLSPLPHEAFVTGHCLASSNQCGANRVTVTPWHTKSVPRMLITSKAAFLENYLVVSPWILHGSSIECHERKRQPFSLSGVWFGSRAILISGWKSASHSTGQKWAFHPCLLLITYSNSQRKTHQIAQIRHSELQKRQYTATEVLLHLFWALTYTFLDISLWY